MKHFQNMPLKKRLKDLRQIPVKDLSELECKRLLMDMSYRPSLARLHALQYRVAVDKTAFRAETVEAIRKDIEAGR